MIIDFKRQKKEDNIPMVRATIDRRLTEIFNKYPKVPIARLITSIFRAEAEFLGDPYYWSENTSLKKIELFQKEMEESYNEEFQLNGFDEPIDEEFLNERIEQNPHLYGR